MWHTSGQKNLMTVVSKFPFGLTNVTVSICGLLITATLAGRINGSLVNYICPTHNTIKS